MKLKEFLQYRTKCPFCSGDLINFGKLHFMFDKHSDVDDSAFIYGGIIYYEYIVDNKFSLHHKWMATSDVYGIVPKSENDKEIVHLMEALYGALPKELRIKKSYPNNVKRDDFSEVLSPWRVHSFDFTFENLCTSTGHFYSYESQQFYNQSANSSNIKLWETFRAFDYVIRNCSSIRGDAELPDRTYVDPPKATDFTIDLPLIPMEKWNTKSKEALTEQINKYLILK